MSRRSALTGILIAVCLLGTVPSCASRKVVSPVTPANVDSFSAWRQQAEVYANLLKATYPPQSDQYKEAERRYIGAESKVNALIDRLLMDFSNGVDVASSEVFADTLDRAVSKATAFMVYMEALFRSTDSRTSGGRRVDRTILNDTSLELWQDYKNASPSRRTVIQDTVRGLKWKPFEELN